MAFLARSLGWFLVVIATLVASVEAVMALGTGTYVGLATRDMWTLLTGTSPVFEAPLASMQNVPVDITIKVEALLARVGTMLMDLPAWTMVGLLGGLLVSGSRVRRRFDHHRRLFR